MSDLLIKANEMALNLARSEDPDEQLITGLGMPYALDSISVKKASLTTDSGDEGQDTYLVQAEICMHLKYESGYTVRVKCDAVLPSNIRVGDLSSESSLSSDYDKAAEVMDQAELRLVPASTSSKEERSNDIFFDSEVLGQAYQEASHYDVEHLDHKVWYAPNQVDSTTSQQTNLWLQKALDTLNHDNSESKTSLFRALKEEVAQAI